MAGQLRVDVRELQHVPVVAISGSIDPSGSRMLQNTLGTLIDDGTVYIVLNLDQVDFIDSVGLGSLVGILRRVSQAGGALCVSCQNPLVLRIFEITGLDRVFEIRGSDREAVALLLSPN